MKRQNCCEYCKIPFKVGEKPFIPVNGTLPYHWNCYIRSIKEADVEEYVEEYNEIYFE